MMHMMLREAILDAGLSLLKWMRCRDIGGFIHWVSTMKASFYLVWTIMLDTVC